VTQRIHVRIVSAECLGTRRCCYVLFLLPRHESLSSNIMRQRDGGEGPTWRCVGSAISHSSFPYAVAVH
jgi:hypothetical protein